MAGEEFGRGGEDDGGGPPGRRETGDRTAPGLVGRVGPGGRARHLEGGPSRRDREGDEVGGPLPAGLVRQDGAARRGLGGEGGPPPGPPQPEGGCGGGARAPRACGYRGGGGSPWIAGGGNGAGGGWEGTNDHRATGVRSPPRAPRAIPANADVITMKSRRSARYASFARVRRNRRRPYAASHASATTPARSRIGYRLTGRTSPWARGGRGGRPRPPPRGRARPA